MKTIKVKLDDSVKSELQRQYYQQVLVRDYPSVKEALTHAVELTTKCEEENWGIVILYFDKMKDIKLMPTHEKAYIVDGVPVEEDYLTGDEDYEVEYNTMHNVPWTVDLIGEGLSRLKFHYDESGNEDNITGVYENIFNLHEESSYTDFNFMQDYKGGSL